MAREVVLADYIERTLAAGAIVIKLSDGVKITVPPAELWPDSTYTALAENDSIEAARAILGPEQHDAFMADGGQWRILNGIIREQQGLEVGESAASSES